jgi:hypothetical protein
MSFRKSLLLLAGLLTAAACADAGAPTSVDRLAVPQIDPRMVLQVLACNVDVRTNTSECQPQQPHFDAAAGAIAIGNVNYVSLLTTNVVVTPDSVTKDVALINHTAVALGTLDGVTAHSTGVRVWVEPAVVTHATVPGLPASVTVANADGILTYKTVKNRPYFQYPGLLQPQDTSIAKTWRFALSNVDAFTYVVWVLTEVQYPSGWLDIIPATPVLGVGTSDTLTAQVRGPYGQTLLDQVSWTSTNPSVVTVAELAADSLAQVTGVAQGTAWVKATSAVSALIRRDSVLVTVY